MAKIISLNKNRLNQKNKVYCEDFSLLQESAKEMETVLQMIEQSLENSAKHGTKNTDR